MTDQSRAALVISMIFAALVAGMFAFIFSCVAIHGWTVAKQPGPAAMFTALCIVHLGLAIYAASTIKVTPDLLRDALEMPRDRNAPKLSRDGATENGLTLR